MRNCAARQHWLVLFHALQETFRQDSLQISARTYPDSPLIHLSAYVPGTQDPILRQELSKLEEKVQEILIQALDKRIQVTDDEIARAIPDASLAGKGR